MNKLAIKQILGLSPSVKVQLSVPTEYHGSAYGGWTIISNSLSRDSTIISAGIGNDISFDLSLIEKYDVNVTGIDPTPGIAEWLTGQRHGPNFNFLPVGLSEKNGESKFFKPRNKNHISHSIRPEPRTENDYVIVPMLTLSSILEEKQIESVDLLKMDIEGFEYAVIRNIVESGIHVHQLLVEFHHGHYGFTNADTENAIRLLNNVGYKVYAVSSTGREISFIKS